MLDASDMNRRDSTEMHAIAESIMNRLSQTPLEERRSQSEAESFIGPDELGEGSHTPTLTAGGFHDSSAEYRIGV